MSADNNLPNDHATHVGCMDGVGTDLATKFARRVSGKRFVDQITRPGIVGRPLTDDVWQQIGISVDHHGSDNDDKRHVVVSSHYPSCAGLQGSREEHVSAVRKTAEAIRQRYADHVPPVEVHPILIVRGPRGRKVHRLG